MRKSNIKTAEILLIVVLVIFIILVGVTYKNLAILSEGMSTAPAVETTTEIVGE